MRKVKGIDLLRILLMFMIIWGHLFRHSGICSELELLSGAWSFAWGTQAITVSAVNCFVLITGYFMIDSNVKVKKAALLWGKVLFYSVTIFLFLTATKLAPITMGAVLNAFFPVLHVHNAKSN